MSYRSKEYTGDKNITLKFSLQLFICSYMYIILHHYTCPLILSSRCEYEMHDPQKQENMDKLLQPPHNCNADKISGERSYINMEYIGDRTHYAQF